MHEQDEAARWGNLITPYDPDPFDPAGLPGFFEIVRHSHLPDPPPDLCAFFREEVAEELHYVALIGEEELSMSPHQRAALREGREILRIILDAHKADKVARCQPRKPK